ncbi:MAG: hypothetical protein ABDI19_12155 [Armatimonadota bacterium]
MRAQIKNPPIFSNSLRAYEGVRKIGGGFGTRVYCLHHLPDEHGHQRLGCLAQQGLAQEPRPPSRAKTADAGRLGLLRNGFSRNT